jgi:hypothetical protein
MTTDPAFPEDRDIPLGADEFYHAHGLNELLVGAEPLDSIHDLFIEGLTDEEADVFLAAIGG